MLFELGEPHRKRALGTLRMRTRQFPGRFRISGGHRNTPPTVSLHAERYSAAACGGPLKKSESCTPATTNYFSLTALNAHSVSSLRSGVVMRSLTQCRGCSIALSIIGASLGPTRNERWWRSLRQRWFLDRQREGAWVSTVDVCQILHAAPRLCR